MNTNPYSLENPIRVIDTINFIEQPTIYTCGQACLAMLVNVSVDDVCKVIGNDKTTTFEDMISALDYYGFKHILREDIPAQLPGFC